jgi:hypothetical protein
VRIPWLRSWCRPRCYPRRGGTVDCEEVVECRDCAGFARLEEQIEDLMDAGARTFHSTSATDIAPLIEGAPRFPRLQPDGRRARAPLRADREGRRAQRHFHVEACDDPPRAVALARELGLGSRRRRAQSGDLHRPCARSSRRSRSRPLHEHPSGLPEPGVHAGVARADRCAASRASRRRPRPGGRRCQRGKRGRRVRAPT